MRILRAILTWILSWWISIVIAGVLFAFGLTPEKWIAGLIIVPPSWLTHEFARWSFVLLGMAILVVTYIRNQHQKPQVTDHQGSSGNGASSQLVARRISRDMPILDAIYYAAFGETDPDIDALRAAEHVNSIGRAIEELRQYARDGELQVWGRKSRTAPYELIPKEYWSKYSIDFLGILRESEEISTDLSEAIIPTTDAKYISLMTCQTKVRELWPHKSS